MFETFDHTADLGLRVRAATLDALFAEAGRGLFSLIVDDLTSVADTHPVPIRLHGEELEYLFFDWLRELLYHFEAKRLVYQRFEVTLQGLDLSAVAYGEPFDPTQHLPNHEVKAITLHGLRVEQEPSGAWLAEVIVDI
jgi:SHS2 domain-containing protein